jgi:uncharacterized membrane protein YuzA (DUF378 family)
MKQAEICRVDLRRNSQDGIIILLLWRNLSRSITVRIISYLIEVGSEVSMLFFVKLGTYVPGLVARWGMWWIDYPTLVLIIAAAIVLGILGVFQINVVEQYLGPYARFVYLLFGFAGIWQMTRQRFH